LFPFLSLLPLALITSSPIATASGIGTAFLLLLPPALLLPLALIALVLLLHLGSIDYSFRSNIAALTLLLPLGSALAFEQA